MATVISIATDKGIMALRPMEKPENISDVAWKMLMDLVQRRVKSLGDLPLFAMRALPERRFVTLVKGEKFAFVPSLERAGVEVVYRFSDVNFFLMLRAETRGRLLDAQFDIQLLPLMQGVWCKEGTTEDAPFRMRFSDLEAFREWYDGKEDGFGDAFWAYEYFNSLALQREMVLFKGDAVMTELKRRWPVKIDKIYVRNKELVVVTKPLSVRLSLKSKKTVDIGRYTLAVAHDASYLKVRRHFGWFSDGFLNPFIHGCDDGKEASVIFYGGEGRSDCGICFGSGTAAVRSAMDVGDVFTVMDALLQLIDQPDWKSDGGLSSWDVLLRSYRAAD